MTMTTSPDPTTVDVSVTPREEYLFDLNGYVVLKNVLTDSHVAVKSSPLLGADNASVYGEWLGLSKPDIEALKKEGVV